MAERWHLKGKVLVACFEGLLAQRIIFKRGDLGATTRFRVSDGIEYDHSGQYMAVGPFEYAWP
jgi:hypothetical protein